jgi:hypothetical protein
MQGKKRIFSSTNKTDVPGYMPRIKQVTSKIKPKNKTRRRKNF